MRNELLEEFAGFTEIDSVSFGERRMADLPVSYTHLTLPTTERV